MHGVHRIIPTDINEITDIIFTENPQNLIIFKGTFLPIGQLHAAGAKRRGRCLAEQLQGFWVCQCLCQVNQLIRQDTHNTVFRTINFTNILIGHCFFHNACQGRIDGSRRPAGLGNQKIFHSNQPFLSLKKGHLKFISQQFFSNFLTGKPKKENHAPKNNLQDMVIITRFYEIANQPRISFKKNRIAMMTITGFSSFFLPPNSFSST